MEGDYVLLIGIAKALIGQQNFISEHSSEFQYLKGICWCHSPSFECTGLPCVWVAFISFRKRNSNHFYLNTNPRSLMICLVTVLTLKIALYFIEKLTSRNGLWLHCCCNNLCFDEIRHYFTLEPSILLPCIEHNLNGETGILCGKNLYHCFHTTINYMMILKRNPPHLLWLSKTFICEWSVGYFPSVKSHIPVTRLPPHHMWKEVGGEKNRSHHQFMT